MSAIPDPKPVARGRLPSGTVSFAFTDIEGSTQRWDSDPAAMQIAVRRHDALMRAAIERHGGYIFKTLGDAFCAAFTRPQDAVFAMLAGQRALAAEDFSAVNGMRVRAAVHTGTADERDGDYFGPVLNRVSRLLAIGHGGQILVSGVAAALVDQLLPTDLQLRDLGEHRLKDLTAPERVFGLAAADLTTNLPPLRSLDAHPNNLPFLYSSFIGRDAEIAAIAALVHEHRIVTIVGAGGIGKTRTALQVAANSLDGSGDGVWFIELAPLATGDNIPAAIAQVLGITLAVGTDPVAQLVRALATKKMLLVFDNCEHLVDAAARIVEAIVRQSPNVHVLATSRQALNLASEQTYRLPSLPFPDWAVAVPLSLHAAAQSGAVALFVDRARAVDNRFELTEANAATVVDICRRLDGIALAIELAAARVKILSPRQLRDRLNERFRVLTGGNRDALPRQQTLRALIDWSYDLLDERERALFARLGVFVDGFTLEAAVAVAAGDELDEFDLIDVLTSLADKSLILAEPAGDSLRYRMLESTRAYALERATAGGESVAIHARHAVYYDAWAAHSVTLPPTERLAAMEAELENLRAVLDWALAAANDTTLGARVALNMGYYWYTRIPHEGLRWIERALAEAANGVDGRLTSRLTSAFASMLPHGTSERVDMVRRALELSRAAGDVEAFPRLLSAYGEQLAALERFDEAQAAFAQALPTAKACGNDMDAARALAGLVELAIGRRDFAAARQQGEAALEIFERIAATDGVAYICMHLGSAEVLAGNVERAASYMRRARELNGKLRNNRSSANAADNLALIALVVGRLDEARAHARDALELLRADRHPLYHTLAIEALAHLATRRGEARRGALLQGYAQARIAGLAHARGPVARRSFDEHMRLLTAAFDEAELATLLSDGARWLEERALEAALEV